MNTLKHNPIIDNFRLQLDTINIKMRSRYSVVLVLSMPKTGGTTVTHALKRHIRNAVFLCHSLDHNTIQKSSIYFQERRGWAPYHLRRANLLRQEFEKSTDKRWKVISIVREPIAREISLFFQTGKECHKNLVDEYGNYRTDFVVEHLRSRIMTMARRNVSKETEWVQSELFETLGLDVFNHCFDHGAGYLKVESDRADLLMIRLENFGRNYNAVISEFLDLPEPVHLGKKNSADAKEYVTDYKLCQSKIRLPEDILRKIYSERYCSHFYTSEHINRFIARWAEG